MRATEVLPALTVAAFPSTCAWRKSASSSRCLACSSSFSLRISCAARSYCVHVCECFYPHASAVRARNACGRVCAMCGPRSWHEDVYPPPPMSAYHPLVDGPASARPRRRRPGAATVIECQLLAELTHVDWRPEHLRRTYHGADRMPPVVSLAARSTLRWCPRFEACTPPGRAQFTQGSREVVHRVSGFGQGRSCATRRLIEDIDSPWHKRRAKPLIRPFPHRFERLAHDSLGQIERDLAVVLSTIVLAVL